MPRDLLRNKTLETNSEQPLFQNQAHSFRPLRGSTIVLTQQINNKQLQQWYVAICVCGIELLHGGAARAVRPWSASLYGTHLLVQYCFDVLYDDR